MMNIFCIGDVIGSPGCEFLRSVLPSFKKVKGVDLCIANGENSEFGRAKGLTRTSAEHLFTSGVDVITTGNHVFSQSECYDYLDNSEFIVRPANIAFSGAPGKGFTIVDMGRVQVAVINLSGTVYMDYAANPFEQIEQILPQVSGCKIKLLDFHAEATSEKRAMGFHLDGRVSAVFGTHTHVQTADEQILPGGTGYITDLGMTGPCDSILGVKKEIILQKFRTNMPVRFQTADGACTLCGCLFAIDEKTGLCTYAERIQIQ